ncbi:8360_t:CDS:10 [Ambispora leptoticha]|uniref:8360_t:CDS:1 n=1 Tax=Ambispora leptoticha TaxID=144679 RepID=A0A9N8V2W9_9GLOM|nr:8360_t:CDS:10 [Ambispora leptoticha]
MSEESAKHATNSVVLKVGMVGDSQIGKTSLMVKYVEGSFDEDYIQTIWDLGGQREFVNMLPLVCNDAMAILFMFDLSRKFTLNSIKEWYRQARGFNKIAIPFLIGTKYDQFATFPNEEKEEITKQARRFAAVMKAPLIFCSTLHSINVQKIFKIVLSKVFDLKCTIPEITEVGEPILEYIYTQDSQQHEEAPDSGVSASGLKPSLFAHIYDDRVDILDTNGSNTFDPDKCKFYRGCLICVFQDHRTNPNPNLTGKWTALRPNSNTLWEDILRMNQAAGGIWTNQKAVELESKLLLAIHPKPNLDPKSTFPGLTSQPVKDDKELPLFMHRDKPKKRKRLLNSLEIELERKNKAELAHLMKTKHPRNRKKFKPDFAQETMFTKNKVRKIITPADSNGKQKLLAQSSQDQSRTRRTLIKRMRWEEILTTSGDQKTKCHTILLVYMNVNSKYDMFIYKINESDFASFPDPQRFIHAIDEDMIVSELKDSRADLTYSFDDEEKWKGFVKQFTVLYGFKNELKFVWSLAEEEEKSLVDALKQIASTIGEITTPEQVHNKDARQLIEKYFSEEPPDHLPQPVYQFTYKDKKQIIALGTVQDYINAGDVNKKMMNIKNREPPTAPLINDTPANFSSGHIRKPSMQNNPIANSSYTSIQTEPGISMPATSLNQAATSLIPNTPINQTLVPPMTNTPLNQIPISTIPNMPMNPINTIPNLPMNRVSMPMSTMSNNMPVSVGAIPNTPLNQMATPSLPAAAVRQVVTPIMGNQQIRQVIPGVPMGQYPRISMSSAQLQQLQQRQGVILQGGNVQQLLMNRGGAMVGNPSPINGARIPVNQAAGIGINNVFNSTNHLLIDGLKLTVVVPFRNPHNEIQLLNRMELPQDATGRKSKKNSIKVARWSALGLGILYGWTHHQSLVHAEKKRKEEEAYKHKQELIDKARAAYAVKINTQMIHDSI